MKVVFICAFAHQTVIEKPEMLTGTIPKEVTCSHIGCGCSALMFPYSLDESAVATHKFYNQPEQGEILSLEESNYLAAGGLMFRTIPEAVPADLKKEFVATEGMNKLAMFIINNFPLEQRLPDIIDTAILLMKKYKGHLSLMKTLNGKTPSGKDLN